MTHNELDLIFPTPNNFAKFHQILFKIATTGAMTDTQTDRETPVILLSVPCYAIAMGHIISTQELQLSQKDRAFADAVDFNTKLLVKKISNA